jgi:tryptophanyl-tRNA synthetase
MTRVLSGVQPSGDMHLGNYLGAFRSWVEDQDRYDAFFCVVDLHALTVAHDPATLAHRTLETVASLLAAGLDPERCTLFVQSHVAEHSRLAWLLECTASMGELRRMTQYKEKLARAATGDQRRTGDQAAGGEEAVPGAEAVPGKEAVPGDEATAARVGLFTYPVLMAADILLYDADRVPVGDDQRQHLELARTLAVRFNHRYGETFVVPEAAVPPVGARVMDLQEPTRKMSKSVQSPQGTIGLQDSADAIRRKVRRAVTDTGTEVRYDPVGKPGVSNLLELLAACTGESPAEVATRYDSYGGLKADVADAVVELLRPLQERYQTFVADPAELHRVVAVGRNRATEVASGTWRRAAERIGLLPG